MSARRAARLLPIPLLLALGGCHLLSPPPQADVAALRAEHQYVSALAALEQQRAGNPVYLQQRQELIEEATLYQSQLVQSLRAAMDRQEYASAQRTLNEVAPQLPPNAELTAFTAEFDRAINRYTQDKLDDLYQLRGEHLLKEQPLYQSLEGIAGDADLQVAVARYQADADYFAKLLAAAGTDAMAREDYAAARKYLTTANQLRPSPQLAADIDTTNRAIDARRERDKQTRISERDQRYRKIESALQQALAQQDFAQARVQLSALRETGLRASEVEDYRHQLDDAIGRFVTAKTDAGNRHYAEGHIEQALEEWLDADALTPTPELKERIEKAEKFIQRYQTLKQQPAPKTP